MIGGIVVVILGVFFGGFICVTGLFFLLMWYCGRSAKTRVDALNLAVEQAQYEFFGNSGVRLRLSPMSGYLMIDFTEPPATGGHFAGPMTDLHRIGDQPLSGGVPPPAPYFAPKEHAKQNGGLNYPSAHTGYAPPPLDELTL